MKRTLIILGGVLLGLWAYLEFSGDNRALGSEVDFNVSTGEERHRRYVAWLRVAERTEPTTYSRLVRQHLPAIGNPDDYWMTMWKKPAIALIVKPA